MDFGDVMSAVSDDKELQPGQLYFALPLSQLRHQLQAEEMATLAVKASSAITKSGDCGGEKCICSWNNLVFPGDSGMRQSRKAAGGGNVGDDGSGRRRRGGGAWRRGKIEARLSAIPE
ncbi:hypothetical protein PHJA_000722500 [Phtheirospermum japonicum]|uniref:Uncharacterized protein n=1 Tax=Phtheirospermum japonicum TaxID=374723 RepID=A0A830BL64_9LAMI|nr:hypothetical protein PHJA_000722500 [Phtheirospermum japonicum]